MNAAPDVLISAEELRAGVARLGAELSARYGEGVVLAAVLKGSLLFLADLVRHMSIDPDVDFLAISSYQPNTGRVRILKDLECDIHGRDVVLVEDIVDTGLTLNYLINVLRARGPRTLKVAALLSKPSRRLVEVAVDYTGFSIDDHFVVGYGLDYNEKYRNLRCIGTLAPHVYS